MKTIKQPDFFQNGYNGFHEWWRYIAGALIIFIIWQLGQIPWVGAIFYKAYKDGKDISSLVSPNEMMNVLPQNLNFFLLLLSFVIGILAIYFIVKILHQQNILSSLTSRSKFDWRRFLFGFALISVFIIAATLIDYYVKPEHYQLNFNWSSFLILAVIGILMVPIQTTFEEWYFRGYLMQGLGYIFKNRAVPLFVTSISFGLLHLGNPEVLKLGYIVMINYIGVGFFLGIITLMDEGLELAAGFHAGNNLITALLVTAEWTAFNTPSILKDVSEPEVTFDILLPIVIFYPILILIMAKVYNWKNWSEKLFGKINLNDDFTQ